ncbi:MAG: acetyl-CoA C-acetyltransferase [Deltaproteobacteria bacterium]|nr:acetyl-CoA C-acetyltransferase [Deltaproteobacteria bacterium]
MRRAAIVSPLRTGVGAYGGTLKPLQAHDLAATVIRALMARTRLDPARVDEVIFGHGYPNGEAPALGRFAGLLAGLPLEAPGYQLDRRCGSGLQAVINAALLVQTGNADVVIAGGAESMSNAEYYTTDMRWGARMGSVQFHDRLLRARENASPEARFGKISGMIETAETLAREFKISREAQDEYALRSQHRAAEAWKAGKFDAELVRVDVPQKKGGPAPFAQDEGVREGLTLADLAKLKPIQKDGTVTAGNASQQNDAAAACLVVAEDKLDELGLKPLGFLKGWASAGCHPATMGLGPVPAVEKLFARTGLGWKDLDLVELNEAFAAQVLAVLKGWNWNDPDKLNVNGSGISLGHPIAATGVRILATLLNELARRGGRYGLETMCIGGGQGLAAVFERE